MSPEEKTELARLNRLFDLMGPVESATRHVYGVNLTAAKKLVLLLRKQIAELKAKIKSGGEVMRKTQADGGMDE